MKALLRSRIRPLIRRLGFDIVRYPHRRVRPLPVDSDELSARIFRTVQDYTATSPERVCALVQAVKYVVSNEIGGAFVECGVWKGGSVMAMALTLLEVGDTTRDIYLYDTFSGMTAPSDADVTAFGAPAQETFTQRRTSEDASDWSFAPSEEVRQNVYSTGYPEHKFHFVKGKVEETIPANMPDRIALLRLDTDWYESTKHELTHLFPRLAARGVLIVDDYGHWLGARKAVDEYISEHDVCLLLNRIDYTGRIAVKME